MQEIVTTLVFSIVLMGIMLYPAIKIAGYIDEKKDISQKAYLAITITIDIALSLMGGLFLSYWDL